jgi:glutaredoxin 3
MNITIYSKANCPNCVTAKQLLKSKGLEFVEFDQERNRDEFLLLIHRYPEVRQMPQIFIDGQRVGGLAGLQNVIKDLGL